MTGQPLRDPAALKSLILTRLDALADPVDPGFGFDMIKLVVLREEKAAPQQWNLAKGYDDTQPLDDLIDRLSARFGPDVVECFEARESHIPERAVKRFAAIHSPAVAWTWRALSPGEPPLRPLLLFSPPQLVETVAEVPDGPPFRFRWRRVLHEISRAEGPERLSAEWWRDSADALTRDYYRVEDTKGRRFWLFRHGIYDRETATPSWYVHGLFS